MSNPIIKAGGVFSSHYLEITFMGVRFNHPDGPRPGLQKWPFSKIACVLLSPEHELFLLVERDWYRIPTKPTDATHQQAIQALVDGLKRNSV